MQNQEKPMQDRDVSQAKAHVAGAHTLLKSLQEKVKEHPEIGEAVTKLEMALAILEVQTGGML